MSVELLPFQKEAKKFILTRKQSILSLATGLGKTITSISAVEVFLRKIQNNKGRCIYVTEDSILPQSVEDIQEHFPELKITRIYKLTPKQRAVAYKEFFGETGQIMVINYNILARDYKTLLDKIKENALQLITILDEANNVRNETTEFHKASKAICGASYFAVALTATPSKQKISDIFGTLKALGAKTHTDLEFRKRFEIIATKPTVNISVNGVLKSTIQSNYTSGIGISQFDVYIPELIGYINANTSAKESIKVNRKNGLLRITIKLFGPKKSYYYFKLNTGKELIIQAEFFTEKTRIGFKDSATFMKEIEDFMFVRSKRSVHDSLPRYTLQKRLVTEKKEVKECIKQLYLENKENDIKSMNYAKLLISQNTPQVYLKDKDDKLILDPLFISAKFEEVLNILNNEVDEDDKVVIYSPWRKSIDILYNILLKEVAFNNKKLIAKISGGADTDNNEERKRFQEKPDCKILLMTDAGTRGLNLQVANHLIFLNMPKDAGDYDQVGGRLPRVGTKHTSLSAYFIIAENTIDQDHYDIVMGNYAFMRSLHKEFGDDSLQDKKYLPMNKDERDEYIFKKLANRKRQYFSENC